MELQSLFRIQAQLDQKILENHQIEAEDLLAAKVLALNVELGELANETRCFKYWSLKPAAPRENILEEYVDALHFILSIGLTLGYEASVQLETSTSVKKEIPAFLDVFQALSIFAETPTVVNYQTLFREIMYLGQALQFEWLEIAEAYLEKNKENHRRQEEGY